MVVRYIQYAVIYYYPYPHLAREAVAKSTPTKTPSAMQQVPEETLSPMQEGRPRKCGDKEEKQ
jgi:hypothetical protein